jgi:hypothetical protein
VRSGARSGSTQSAVDAPNDEYIPERADKKDGYEVPGNGYEREQDDRQAERPGGRRRGTQALDEQVASANKLYQEDFYSRLREEVRCEYFSVPPKVKTGYRQEPDVGNQDYTKKQHADGQCSTVHFVGS